MAFSALGRLFVRHRNLMCSAAMLALLAANLLTLAQSTTKPISQLILLDGTPVPFQSLEIAGGKLHGDGLPADLTLDDLRRIELAAATTTTADQAAVVADLRGGGKIQAKSISIGEDKCQLAWAIGEPLSLPLDIVRAIRLAPTTSSLDFEKALATPSAELDRVFVKDDAAKLSSVAGLIKSLTAQQLTIEIGAEALNVPHERLFGIVIAQAAASETMPRCVVTFQDGSTIGGDSLALADGRATLSFPAGAAISFPWTSVARVTVRSSRVAYLSDLKQLAEEQLPIVTLPLPAQRDKSVMGTPLALGTRVFEKGLGVHARSSLTFAADKKWDVFAATIGIDAEAAGKGDCVFSVLADGQPLISRRMRGGDPPYEIEVPIANRAEIILIVEPGEGLDLADHADWCDARFIKSRPK